MWQQRQSQLFELPDRCRFLLRNSLFLDYKSPHIARSRSSLTFYRQKHTQNPLDRRRCMQEEYNRPRFECAVAGKQKTHICDCLWKALCVYLFSFLSSPLYLLHKWGKSQTKYCKEQQTKHDILIYSLSIRSLLDSSPRDEIFFCATTKGKTSAAVMG
jgi:hypothetical protein